VGVGVGVGVGVDVGVASGTVKVNSIAAGPEGYGIRDKAQVYIVEIALRQTPNGLGTGG